MSIYKPSYERINTSKQFKKLKALMAKKQLQAKYDKLLKEYEKENKKQDARKKELAALRRQIIAAPDDFDPRPDELIMKAE